MAQLANRLAQAGIVLTPDAAAPSAGAPEPAAAAAQPSSALVTAGLGFGGLGAAMLALTLALRSAEREPAPTVQPPSVPTATVDAADSPSPVPLRSDRPGSRAPTLQRSDSIRPDETFEAPAAPQPARQEPAELAEPPTSTRNPPITRQGEAQRDVARDPAAPAPTAVATSTAAPRQSAQDSARDSEIELLKRARSALTSDPEEALALARRHRTEYPRGAYTQERDVIAISALARLGRSSDANRLAEAFRDRYPRSAYLPQVDRILGKAP
jgi:hypothetical protein